MDNTGDISSMIGRIMSDPAFAEMVGRLKSENSSADSESKPAPEISDVMSTIEPILSGIGNDSGKHKQEQSENNRPDQRENQQHRFKKHDKAQAEKLLYALKPYLNKNRCEIIDKCVSVMQITDIVSAFGGIEGLLKTAGI